MCSVTVVFLESGKADSYEAAEPVLCYTLYFTKKTPMHILPVYFSDTGFLITPVKPLLNFFLEKCVSGQHVH